MRASRPNLRSQPASQWIAPQWGGAWDQHGLFREHPVGILLPSVVLIRLGVPGAQAAYIVNMIYQAAVIALIPLLAGIVLRATEARPLAWVPPRFRNPLCVERWIDRLLHAMADAD